MLARSINAIGKWAGYLQPSRFATSESSSNNDDNTDDNRATPIKIITVFDLSYPGNLTRFPLRPTPVQTMNDSATPRCVTGIPANVGPARAEETPGMTTGSKP